MAKALSVVIPAYCEEACIEKVLKSWNEAFKKTVGPSQFEIIVVNDGSKDGTGNILDRLAAEMPTLKVIHQKNAGHGAAVLRGYREAVASDWVFQVDSDDQFEPAEFERLWKMRDRSRFILGHRETRHDARHRLVISFLARKLVWALFGVEGKDFNIPFRLMQGEMLGKLADELPGTLFAPNIFLAILASALGEDLKYVPVTHKPRTTGRVSILRWGLVKVCWRTLTELLEFRSLFSETVALMKEEAPQKKAPAPSRRAVCL
jgi:dolichol-phosphate mannosyltransferase